MTASSVLNFNQSIRIHRMSGQDPNSAVARRVLDRLREELRQSNYSMRSVSSNLGLRPDHLATIVSRGYMDVGIFFAAVEMLGLDPRIFLDNNDGAQASPPRTTLPVTTTVVERLLRPSREGDE